MIASPNVYPHFKNLAQTYFYMDRKNPKIAGTDVYLYRRNVGIGVFLLILGVLYFILLGLPVLSPHSHIFYGQHIFEICILWGGTALFLVPAGNLLRIRRSMIRKIVLDYHTAAFYRFARPPEEIKLIRNIQENKFAFIFQGLNIDGKSVDIEIPKKGLNKSELEDLKENLKRYFPKSDIDRYPKVYSYNRPKGYVITFISLGFLVFSVISGNITFFWVGLLILVFHSLNLLQLPPSMIKKVSLHQDYFVFYGSGKPEEEKIKGIDTIEEDSSGLKIEGTTLEGEPVLIRISKIGLSEIDLGQLKDDLKQYLGDEHKVSK